MKKCPVCKAVAAKRGVTKLDQLVGDEKLTVTGVPALICGACGEVVISGRDLEVVELTVAAALAERGRSDGEAVRFMRKALGLRASDLGDLVGYRAEEISRWENGHTPPPTLVVAALRGLVEDRLNGREDTLRRLKRQREPKRVGRTIPFRLVSAH